jgi:hypothetical protein
MEPNPYEAPKEQGYELPQTSDSETFSTTRLFLFALGIMVLSLILMALR